MRKIEVSKLIMDYNFYPRNKVDSMHANYMVESMKAGVEMPPVIADEKSLRIVDGFHRVAAFKKLYGNSGEINAILKKYRNDADLFIDAMKYNANHGRRLTEENWVRCIIRCEELKIDESRLASALNLTKTKIGQLKAERIGELHIIPIDNLSFKKGKKKFANHKAQLIPLKSTISYKAGESLTQEQVAVNDKLDGHNVSFTTNQLIMLIESDLIDFNNRNIVEKLKKLYELLNGIDFDSYLREEKTG